MIEFLCPNGHRIRCQAEQAGRPAKCPRCGVKFLVPSPNDSDVSEAVGSDSKVSRPEFTDSDVAKKKPAFGGGMSLKEPQIEFLCPNGHRLHGSPSLQGRPGECPECGSRFRIPTYDEISFEEEAVHDIGLGHANGREGSGSDARLMTTPAMPTSESLLPMPTPSKDRTPAEEVTTPTTISGRGEAGQSMAALVARLWDMRPAGTTVELRLRDGETVVPSQFLKKLSDQTHQGVFAVSEADGSVSLTAVAWDAIARTTLRGLKELPKELAE